MDNLLNKMGTGLTLAIQVPFDSRRKNLYTSIGYDYANDTWETIVKYHGDLNHIATELNVVIEILTEKYAIITLKTNKIASLLSYNEIEYIEKPKPVFMSLTNSLNKSCIGPAQVTPYDLHGDGTIIGIIDTGIDYTHPDFINDDGTSRILYIWDQTIIGNPPEGFNIGSEYTNETINNALKITNAAERREYLPHEDFYGHGTNIAGIAAGNGRASNGTNKGIADKASLIIVKLGQVSENAITKTTEIARALKYVLDKAEELNMPISINLSYGTNEGNKDGTSLFDVYINDISQRWKNTIAVAVGNDATSGQYKSGILIQNNYEEIEFVVSSDQSSISLEVWKAYIDKFDIEIISPSYDSTGRISFRSISQYFELCSATVYIEFGTSAPFSERDSILLAFIPQEQLLSSGIWTIRFFPVDIVTGNYQINLLASDGVETNSYFLISTRENTITNPSTANMVISVGGYDDRTDKISYFSGRGPIPYNNKPDLVAPAENVLSTTLGGGYDTLTGTSIAAPFVAGSAALIMEWGIVKGNDQFLYGQRVKSVLKAGARKVSNINYPNSEYGYGMLCLADSLRYLRRDI